MTMTKQKRSRNPSSNQYANDAANKATTNLTVTPLSAHSPIAVFANGWKNLKNHAIITTYPQHNANVFEGTRSPISRNQTNSRKSRFALDSHSDPSHTLSLESLGGRGGIVTNFPFSVHYLRLMLDLHAFACFILFLNIPFPYVNSMYFIHAYSSRLPYSLHAFYLMYITRLPRLRLIPS